MEFIPYGRQSIDDEDTQAILETLRSPFLTQGPKVAEFEAALCAYTGARYCVAVASGTAALHLAVAALELMPGGEGITTPNTFTATANSMAYCGLIPRFADIDGRSYNVSPDAIEKQINAHTSLLIPVHFGGYPANMQAISAIAHKYKLRVIEDAAHAIGSSYADGGKVGNCRYSDLTIFSFHPVKTITSGEGGAITTNDPILYERIMLLRTHGITKDPAQLRQNPGPWYYEMHALGYHYRITDMQAALGLSQLKKLDRFAERRRAITASYNAVLAGLDWLITPSVPDALSCPHLYVVQIDFERLGIERADVMKALSTQGIGSQVHYIPVHMQPWYQQTYGYRAGDYPKAEAYYQRCLSLPLYPAMSETDIGRVTQAIIGVADTAH